MTKSSYIILLTKKISKHANIMHKETCGRGLKQSSLQSLSSKQIS